MTRATRERNALLPVNRRRVSGNGPNRAGHDAKGDTRIPLTSLTEVTVTGPGPRKGKARQKIGMWGTISTDYRTAATHDAKWDATVSTSQGVTGAVTR